MLDEVITPQQAKFDEAREMLRMFSLSGERKPEFFSRFKKKTFEGEFKPESYHISGRCDPRYCWNPDPYVDAWHPLVLRHDGKVIVMSSFSIVRFSSETGVTRSNELDLLPERDYPITVQLQGQMFCEDLLRPLKWERLLVTAMEDWARKAGFNSCLGLPAEKNPHPGMNRPEMHLRYDVTFKRMSYKMDRGYWKKNLTA